MCLQQPRPVDVTPRQENSSKKEDGVGDEDEDGGRNMEFGNSRNKKNSNTTDAENDEWERKAELWRLNPAFELDEVVMTRLGAPFIFSSFPVSSF